MLTGHLRDGTEYLSASTVRRVVQVASVSVVGSAIAVTRLDKEVRRVTATYPEEDPITLADHMVRMCEEEVLDWMRTRTVHEVRTRTPILQGVRQARSWSMTWRESWPRRKPKGIPRQVPKRVSG
jgi:hypothetical protein